MKNKWNELELKSHVKNSLTYVEVLNKIGGLSKSSGNYRTLKRYIKKFKIDTDHFKRPIQKNFQKKNLCDILVENSLVGSYRTKNRLLKEGLLINKCSICGQGPLWKGKKLNMILDHINGVFDDNRIENLRLACPNCNSQFDTNCGKNIKNLNRCLKCSKYIKKNKSGLCKICSSQTKKNKECTSCGKKIKSNKNGKCFLCFDRKIVKDRPDKDQLLEMILKMPMTKIGKKYGVSDQAVKKWCKSYGIIMGNRLGYWSKIKATGQVV